MYVYVDYVITTRTRSVFEVEGIGEAISVKEQIEKDGATWYGSEVASNIEDSPTKLLDYDTMGSLQAALNKLDPGRMEVTERALKNGTVDMVRFKL